MWVKSLSFFKRPIIINIIIALFSIDASLYLISNVFSLFTTQIRTDITIIVQYGIIVIFTIIIYKLIKKLLGNLQIEKYYLYLVCAFVGLILLHLFIAYSGDGTLHSTDIKTLQ